MSEADPSQGMAERGRRIAILQYAGVTPAEAAGGLGDWADRLLHELAPDCTSLVVRLVSDEEMRRMNRAYRDRDEVTDVLSFPGEETPDERHLGDVLIALPVAERQAMERHHSPSIELKLLVLHGILHCMGYDHEVDGGQMDELEEELRRLWIPETADSGATHR